MPQPVLNIQNLTFSYRLEERTIQVLRDLTLTIQKGEFVGIQGPSGSGKSTLFYILGFLLRATSGQITFNGINVQSLSQDELTWIRNQKIGFIFQQFHLLPNADCLKNILLPTRYPSELAPSNEKLVEKAIALAHKLGLSHHLRHRPNQLSGGQQQRVAIARALIHDVDLILADEPTGNLDSHTAKEIMALLQELNDQGKTIVLITHDVEIARYCSKVYHLRDGQFTEITENRPHVSAVSLPEDNTQQIPLPSRLSFHAYLRIFRSLLPLVWENLLRNRLKTFLTMLGVVIGIAAVLAMITLGQFTQKRIMEGYEALGVNKLLIRGFPNFSMRATDRVAVNFQSFDWFRDLLPLRKIFPEIHLMSPYLHSANDTATAGGISITNKVESHGVNSEYLAITNRSLLTGSGLTSFHVQRASPVCVIGYEIAEKLFSRTSALGQILVVTDNWRLSYPCRIIGVLARQTTAKEGSSPNLHVLVPYTYFGTVAPGWWFRQIHVVALQIKKGADVEQAGAKIKAFFQQKYGNSGEFHVDSDSALVAQTRRFLNIFSALLTSIALLSLLVGGIGINNMILVSVTERIKEFGIRKALGATDRSIRFLVIMESSIICGIAGAIGAFVGFFSYELMIYGATRFIPALQFEWIILPSAVLLSVMSIVLVGLFSGLIPALKAEKLQIIEALRSE